jgi:hypothetical protein
MIMKGWVHFQGLVQAIGNDLIATCREEVTKSNSSGDNRLTVH